MDEKIQRMRELIANFGRDLYLRRLTDTSGGNLSVRMGDVVLMTPTLAGTLYHWNLRPEQVCVFDIQGNQLDGEGKLSREAKVHFALYEEFYPDGQAIIHSHPQNVLVFCAAERSMEPVLYNVKKFGVIPQVVDAASGTQALADNVVTGMLHQRQTIAKSAGAVMAPRHGLFVIAKDLYVAFDITDRIDTNAYCLIQGKGIGDIFPILDLEIASKSHD